MLHRSEEGYSVWIPGLPGCCSQGETEAEAIVNIKIAAQEYLSAVEELIEGGEVGRSRWLSNDAEDSGRQSSCMRLGLWQRPVSVCCAKASML